MKLINIIAVALLIGFASCSKEEAIDKLPIGGSTTLDIVISPSVLMSKTTAGISSFATDDELTINDCILAIFKKEGNNWVKQSIEHYELAQPASSADIKSGYIIAGNVTLSFDDVYMLRVIANPMAGNAAKYEACESLDAFKDIVEGGEVYAFDPTRLVKVGDLEIGPGTRTVLDKNSEEIIVPLTQLAARVDLEVKLDLGDKKLLESKYENTNGSELGGVINDETLIANYPSATELSTAQKKELLKKAEVYYLGKRVSFQKVSQGSLKAYLVSGYTANRIDVYEAWTLELTGIEIHNVRTQAIAVLSDIETGMHIDVYTPNSFNLKMTFYTYEKGYDTETPLSVVLQGDVYKINEEKKTEVKCDWYVFNNFQDAVDLSKDPVLVDGGWGPGGQLFFVEDHNNTWTEVEGGSSFDEETKVKTGDCSKTFNIEPTAADGATDGILPGNLYDVSITITKVDRDVAPIIEWTVLDWNDVPPVNIPDFN